MATKKLIKKAKKGTAKKAVTNQTISCATQESCGCKGILALIIIALTWWKPATTWAQITITIMAAIILLSGNSCFCKK